MTSNDNNHQAGRATDLEDKALEGIATDTDNVEEKLSENTNDLVGSSGHIPRTETAELVANHESTGSPGAEADRKLAEGDRTP